MTNPTKVRWPETGFTKADMAAYYTAVAPVLIPHLEGRPLTLRRFPDGVEGLNWYQNVCRGAPEWVRTVELRGQRFCVVDSVESLLWVCNLGSVELHPFATRVDAVSPSYLVFDLDPGEDATIVDCCAVALLLRDVLDGIVSVPKTSGVLGLHVYVPLNSETASDQAKAYARSLARRLASEHPELVVDVQDRSRRRGRVLVDWLQNDPARSTIAPYSLRAMPWPLVSTPLDWREVEEAREADALYFDANAVAERVEQRGDLFAPVLEVSQLLPS